MKLKPCKFGGRHSWEYVKDVTMRMSPRPGCVRFARKSFFKCACGERKYGPPRTGL